MDARNVYEDTLSAMKDFVNPSTVKLSMLEINVVNAQKDLYKIKIYAKIELAKYSMMMPHAKNAGNLSRKITEDASMII